MAAAQYDFTIEQGSKFTLPLEWRSDGGAPVDITGYSVRMQIRQSVNAPDVLLEATTANGLFSIDGPAGRLTLTLPSSLTAAISWSRGRYDIELVDPAGEARRLIQGSVSVSREVTRG